MLDAFRVTKRERRCPQPAHRVADESDRRQLLAVQDVADETMRVREKVNAPIVEGVGQPVARSIDGQHSEPARQVWEKRPPVKSSASAAVNEQQRWSLSAIDEGGRALGPFDTAHLEAGCASTQIRRMKRLSGVGDLEPSRRTVLSSSIRRYR